MPVPYPHPSWPALLSVSSFELRAAYEHLLAALRINSAAVVDMLSRAPALLCVEPSTIAAHLDAMLYTLYLPRKQALDMLVRQPALLLYKPVLLVERVQALQVGASLCGWVRLAAGA